MSTEQNKITARKLIEEVLNKGNLAPVDEIFTTNYVYHDPGTPWLPANREGVKQFVSTYRTAFPDLRITVEQQIAEGDWVVTRWAGYGTNKGKLLEHLPTGKQATVTGITISRFVGGKIAESWINWEALELMQQIGVLPKLELAGRQAL